MSKVNKRVKIAFVARTIGLEYDDRIRKECITLIEQGAEVNIYVNFYDNREETGITSYGVKYRSFKLISRDFMSPSKFLTVKAFEFYIRVRKFINNYDLVWAHEEYTFMFPLLAKKDKCIWDLHEVPFRFESKSMKKVFNFIEKKSRKLIHANKHRIDYLIDSGVIKYPNKHVYINNLPDDKFVNSDLIDPKYKNFEKWLGTSNYVYVQGLAVPTRYPENTIEAILGAENLKAVVVGDIDSSAYTYLFNKYGDELRKRVYFVGMVNQLAIAKYLKCAQFSIVLYDTNSPNNKYCEPNRLYQSLAMGVPVIVGCNPTMEALVRTNKFGVTLTSDGESVEDLNAAITVMLSQRDKYTEAISSNKHKVIWSNKCISKDWYSNN